MNKRIQHVGDRLQKLNIPNNMRTCHIAAIFQHSSILFTATNMWREEKTQHAEYNILNHPLRRRYQGKNYELIVIRRMKNGELGNSRPCQRCAQDLKKHGWTKVWYSTGNPHEPFKKLNLNQTNEFHTCIFDKNV